MGIEPGDWNGRGSGYAEGTPPESISMASRREVRPSFRKADSRREETVLVATPRR